MEFSRQFSRPDSPRSRRIDLQSTCPPASCLPAPCPSAPVLAADGKNQILAKKGFLRARNITSDFVLLVYSRQYQVGILLHLASATILPEQPDSDAYRFAKSAVAMILSEFEQLGVHRRDLTTFLVGGSSQDDQLQPPAIAMRSLIRKFGLVISADDLGGLQARSVWLDVETGRTLIRSRPRQETFGERAVL